MFLSSSSLPSIPCVTVTTRKVRMFFEVPDGPSVCRDAEGETQPPYFVLHNIVKLGHQLNWTSFGLMRFDEDRIQVRDETGEVYDKAVCALLRKWKQWGFKGVSFLRLTDPTPDMSFDRCYEECRYAERHRNYNGEISDSQTVPSQSFSMFFFFYPYWRLWFFRGMKFRWRDVDFEVRRHAWERRRFILSWRCVNLGKFPLSRSGVFLFPSVVKIDDREGLRRPHVPNSSRLPDYIGLVFNQGAATRLSVRISQVYRTVMTDLQFPNCAMYSV